MPSSRFPREFARRLRRSQTDAEYKLWTHLRARQIEGTKFRRQFPIGPYIVDFCCLERTLIVEVDGGQHTAQARADEQRTAALKRLGYRVLRFWDNEVLLETDAVLERIAEELRGSSEK